MTEILRISKQQLSQIPDAVRTKMDEAGLSAPLENLLDRLNSDYAQESEDQQFLFDLLDWIILRLSDAREPLPTQVFNNLNSYLNNLQHMVERQDWHNARNHVADILRELSMLPAISPQYSTESARTLNQAMNNARRQLRASATRLDSAHTELQQTIDKAISAKTNETSERFESVLGTAQRLSRETIDEIASLRDTANEYLEEIREANRLSADAEVGGGHIDASNRERERADLWRWIALGAWMLSAAVAGGLIVLQFKATPAEWDWTQWVLRMPLGLSLIGAVAAIGKYASSQSAGHRSAEWHLRNRALALRQVRLAVHDLSSDQTNVSDAAKQLLSQVGPVLYSDRSPDEPVSCATAPDNRSPDWRLVSMSRNTFLASILSLSVVVLVVAVLALIL